MVGWRGWAAVGVAGLTAVSVVSGATPASAANSPRPLMTGWMPYWTTDASMAAYTRNADLFADISPFWHDTEQAGPNSVRIIDHLSAGERRAQLARMRTAGKPIIPSITDGTGGMFMTGVLSARATRAAHVRQLVDLVMANGYDGIDLDYEQFAFADDESSWGATRARWGAFVTELATALHARGKLLTAAVPTSAYWVYNFPTLGRVADRVRVMTYDWSVSDPGPIAPINWVRTETDRMVAMIPARKLFMGVPTYGRDWVRRDANGDVIVTDRAGRGTTLAACPAGYSTKKRVIEASETYSEARRYGATPKRDPESGEVTYRYGRSYSAGGKFCTIQHVVWAADVTTVVARTDAVLARGVAGIAVWTVGGEDSGQWAPLRARAWARSPKYPTVASFVAPQTVVAGTVAQFRVRAQSAGKPLAGVRITLASRKVGTAVWTPVQAKSTAANGVIVFELRPTETRVYQITIPGEPGRTGLVIQSPHATTVVKAP